MNTVTDLEELCPRVVTDRSEIDQLRWFQMNRYFEGGLLDELPSRLPDDPLVHESTYFGVYEGAKIQATARIVRATTSLPMLEHHALYPSFKSELDVMHGTVAEISRLAVDSSTQHYRALGLLSREFLRFGLLNQHATILIASVERPLVRILNRLLGVPLQIIGPPIEQYGSYPGECVPIMIDTIECLKNFQAKNSRRWEFFVDGLVLDFTDSAEASSTNAVANELLRAAS